MAEPQFFTRVQVSLRTKLVETSSSLLSTLQVCTILLWSNTKSQYSTHRCAVVARYEYFCTALSLVEREIGQLHGVILKKIWFYCKMNNYENPTWTGLLNHICVSWNTDGITTLQTKPCSQKWKHEDQIFKEMWHACTALKKNMTIHISVTGGFHESRQNVGRFHNTLTGRHFHLTKPLRTKRATFPLTVPVQ